jgi:hypothetical protein
MQVSKEDKAQLAALEAAVAAEDKAIAKLQRDMAGLNAEAVAAALEAVGGEELQQQRALVDSLQQVGTVQGMTCTVALRGAPARPRPCASADRSVPATAGLEADQRAG